MISGGIRAKRTSSEVRLSITLLTVTRDKIPWQPSRGCKRIGIRELGKGNLNAACVSGDDGNSQNNTGRLLSSSGCESGRNAKQVATQQSYGNGRRVDDELTRERLMLKAGIIL